jgi:SAM-dependent methyltransferase
LDNSEQVEFWNSEAAVGWVKAQEQMDQTLAPLSALAIEAAGPAPGERAIDVGCGCGTTTFALADGGATVRGVDLSKAMLAHAKKRAADRKDVSFSCADAATQAYTPDHDLVFSRFGVMFFADPVAAFANIRTALNESGRMAFICWRTPAENQWMSLPAAIMRKYVESPPPQDPLAPGPFAFADRNRLDGILSDAGFKDIVIERLDADFPVAPDLEAGLKVQTTTGPMARMFSMIPDEKKEAAIEELREALAPHVGDDGLVFRAAAWLVKAHR